MSEKLTLDDLLSHKLKIEPKTAVEFYSSMLGGVLTICKIPKRKFQSIIEKLTPNSTEKDQEIVENKLIYESIPLLQNPQLIKEYQCGAPYDIVDKIFGDNLYEISQIIEIIYSFYGVNLEEINEIKKS